MAHCFNLHDSLLEVAEDLPVTLEKVMPVIDEVKKEISAIKDWRKAENAVLQICMGHVEQRKRAAEKKAAEAAKQEESGQEENTVDGAVTDSQATKGNKKTGREMDGKANSG